MELSARDLSRLKGVHPDLVRVVKRAAMHGGVRFTVIEGTRTVEKQREYVRKGASKTMNSRHIPAPNGYGHAVDIAPIGDDGKISWAWPLYTPLAKAMKAAAKAEAVPIEWGGDWKSFKDGPHWQLPWKQYPGAHGEVAHEKPITEPRSDRMATSRTVQGSAVAAAGGATVAVEPVIEIANKVQEADAHISAGTIIGLVIGLLIIAGALYALYARWDDAGRPKPWRKS